MDINKLLVDVSAIEGGKWIPLGADFPKIEVNVCGLSSKSAKVYRDSLERKAPREDRLRDGSLTSDAQDLIIRKVILAHCLKDWKGFTQDGKPVPYNRETAELFMLKPEGRVVGKAIVEAIIALEDTRLESEEAMLGN